MIVKRIVMEGLRIKVYKNASAGRWAKYKESHKNCLSLKLLILLRFMRLRKNFVALLNKKKKTAYAKKYPLKLQEVGDSVFTKFIVLIIPYHCKSICFLQGMKLKKYT